MSLRDWQRNSWLVEHKNSRDEITALLAIVERDLANAKVAGLADDWQVATRQVATVGSRRPIL